MKFLVVIGFMGFYIGGIAQNSTKTPPRGHALYKLSKIYDSRVNDGKPKSKQDRAEDRYRFEFERTKDPKTGKVPDQIRDRELEFSSGIAVGTDLKNLVSSQQKSHSKNDVISFWRSRGPFNVGGRTRALAIDRTNENIILAGGVSGGLWRSEDQGASWKRVTTIRQSPSITTIVQDPRPGKERIWYYGSGELISNSAGALSSGQNGFVDAPYYGSGIYKSYNGGRSFQLLEATDDGNLTDGSPFDVIIRLAIHPISGDLYVATAEGLFISRDGGESFQPQPQLSTGGLEAVEVAISSTGQIYATVPNENNDAFAVFTSTDGQIWTKISTELTPFGNSRTLIAIDPQQEHIVYFFGSNTLLKYDASQELEDAWTDLSDNLPNDLNIQSSYNMTLDVHPKNSNVVFLGGTNLYRSETAFSDPNENVLIVGGYSPGISNNNGGTAIISSNFYSNHHADQHELLFFPSDPNKALSANDGGVYVTDDILNKNINTIGESVEWTSLNNGYLTTQPYAVSFDPNSNKEEVLAGFQDNGSWYTGSSDPTAPWIEDLGADGGYSAIADNGKTRYVTFQNGGIFRLNFDDDGNYISYAALSPEGGTNQFSFITPFVIDPSNDNVMYIPENNKIWVNSNLDEIPIAGLGRSNVNWKLIENQDLGFLDRITALDVSKYPKANVLYYGTRNGKIYKINNALLNDQSAEDIFTGKGLPEGGYINDITVDPSNSDRVIVVYSSYGIPSLFLTDNGGESWIDISSNLEENPDGSGDGPSVRCAGFFGSGTNAREKRRQRVFVGTSTGLYYANRVDASTRWRKENFKVGNKVVEELGVRKDGFIALASHGNGIISARFPIFDSIPESKLKVAFQLENQTRNIGTRQTKVNVKGLFVHEDNEEISISTFSSNPELVSMTIENDTLILSHTTGQEGKVFVGLIAKSGIEEVSEEFELLLTKSIDSQNESVVWGVPSQYYTDFDVLVQAADDFTIPEGEMWDIEKINALGVVQGNNPRSRVTSATIVIYEDINGSPGKEIFNSNPLNVSQNRDGVVSIDLAESQKLNNGTYWISVYANLEFGEDFNEWFWLSQAGGLGNETHFKDEFDVFEVGAVEWTPLSQAFPDDNNGEPLDQIFQIFGVVQSTDNAVSKSPDSLKNDLLATVYPNPSTDKFIIDFSKMDADENVSIKVYDMTGRILIEKTGVATDDNFVWDASSQTQGFYFVNVKGDFTDKTFKILKK